MCDKRRRYDGILVASASFCEYTVTPNCESTISTYLGAVALRTQRTFRSLSLRISQNFDIYGAALSNFYASVNFRNTRSRLLKL